MKKVVVIGGGTGTFAVLKGLKHYPLELTAIVTTFDSGGSTGMLRDEFGTLPSGDIRRCLVALVPENGDSVLRDLFNYRFDSGSSLHGHSFGNLFLHALSEISGSRIGGIRTAVQLLNCKGNVLPVSIDDADLCAELLDGQVIRGETNIDIPKHSGKIPIKRVFLDPQPMIFEEAYSAIVDADLIVIGPGDLYTSIIPNTLVKGFTDSLNESNGKIAYVLNIMTKWGETNDFTASRFAGEMLSYLGKEKLDYIICNSALLDPKLIENYSTHSSYPVPFDGDELEPLVGEVVLNDIVNQTDIIRHDPGKLARVLVSLCM